jgi:hypothetical protein
MPCTALFKAEPTNIAPTGLDIIRLPLGNIVDWLLTTSGLKRTIQRTRDEIIRLRYEAGVRISDLAREFGISPQRVFQIVSHGRKEENSV